LKNIRNKEIGEKGENLAVEFLKSNGYKILERNKHFSRLSEVDIIATDKNNTLVFVEVKTRTTENFGIPFEAISKMKYSHIKQGLFMYLSDNPTYKKYRIDAISVVLTPKICIEHLKNL